MTRKKRLLILSVALLIANATALHAAQVNFTPAFFVSEEYTDNLFLSPDDTKVDEFITIAGVNLSGEILGRSAGLELNYNPSYYAYADRDDLDYWRHAANILFYKGLGRNTTIELSSAFLSTQTARDSSERVRRDDSSQAGAAGTEEEATEGEENGDAIVPEGASISVDNTRRGRDEYRQLVNNIRLNHQYGFRSNVYAGVRYNIYEDPDVAVGEESNENKEWLPEFGFTNWFNQRWGLAFAGSYSDRDYDDRDDRKEYYGSLRLLRNFNRRTSGFIEVEHTTLDFDEETDDEDYRLFAPSIGFQYQIARRTDIELGAGYYIQEFDESEDEEGFYVNGDIAHEWIYRQGRIRLDGGSGYDVEDQGSEDLGLQIYYEVGLDARYNFTSRFFGELYTSYRYDDYPNRTPDRSDQTFEAGAKVNYQALRWMSLELAYDFSDVTSDIDTVEYTENRVILTIT